MLVALYLHNLQGDIVGIVDAGGQTVVQYSYDAWGEPIGTVSTLITRYGSLNLFRYRAYVYDEEIGLFYLRSRYYHPYIQRFANCEIPYKITSKINGFNSYAYCRNATVSFRDMDGYEEETVIVTVNFYATPIVGNMGDLPGHCDLTYQELTYSFYPQNFEDALSFENVPSMMCVRTKESVKDYTKERGWFSPDIVIPKTKFEYMAGILKEMKGDRIEESKDSYALKPSTSADLDLSFFNLFTQNCFITAAKILALADVDLSKEIGMNVLGNTPRNVINTSKVSLVQRNSISRKEIQGSVSAFFMLLLE